MNLYSLSLLWKAFHNKDSTAMVLKMIEEDIPIDCIQAGLYGPGTGDALSV